MAVYVSNIVINSGTTFSETFTLESATTNSAFNLTGYAGAAQMRKHAGSSTATDFELIFRIPSYLWTDYTRSYCISNCYIKSWSLCV